MKQARGHAGMASPTRGGFRPTPIRILRRTRTVSLALGLVALVLLMWAAPTVPITLLGGFALAMPLSFPVRWLLRVMPRGFAILISFIRAAPGVLRGARETLLDMFEPLSELELLQGTSYEFMTSVGQDLVGLAQNAAQQVLGSLIGFVSVTFGVALSLFAPPFRHERRGCHLHRAAESSSSSWRRL